MRRREFITGVGAAAAWPMVARAQRPDAVKRIGWLRPGDQQIEAINAAFLQSVWSRSDEAC
jgi:putative ABC transport system substrate-binding protein